MAEEKKKKSLQEQRIEILKQMDILRKKYGEIQKKIKQGGK